ncbi:MAG: CDP-diacylglycerol--glycerol-3-phosphate 3-phosphatidyltransferase [Nitrospirota bacterium]
MNLPNLLTFLRLGCIPILILIYYLPLVMRFQLAAVVFVVAAATDFVDGYIARRREQITNLGKLLDPVADKLLISTGLLLLVEAGRLWAWLAILIIGREIAVTGLRAVASSKGIVMQAEGMGKLKMAFQVVGVTLLFLADPAGQRWLWQLGLVVIAIAAILALISGWRYALRAGRLFSLE